MSQDFSPEKLVSDIVTNLIDPTKKALFLQTKINRLKELHKEMAACRYNSPKHTEYVNLRNEVAELLMPLLEDLDQCEMFSGANFKTDGGHYSTTDSLGEPCVNGGIQLSIQNRWCDDCQNWGGIYCRECGKEL